MKQITPARQRGGARQGLAGFVHKLLHHRAGGLQAVDQPGTLASLDLAAFDVAVQRGLLERTAREERVKRGIVDGVFRGQVLAGKCIAQHAHGRSAAAHQGGVGHAGCQHGGLVSGVDARLGRQQKARAQLRAGRAQAQGGGDASAVGDAAGRHDGQRHTAQGGAQQHLQADFVRAGVSAGFQAHGDHGVHARRLRFFRVHRTGHDLQPFGAGVARAADMLLRATLGGDDHWHALRDGDIHVFLGALVVEGDIDGEGRVGAAPHFAHRGEQGFRIHGARGDHTQAARAGHGQRQRCVGRCPAHATLDDGIAGTQQPGQRSLQSHGLACLGKRHFLLTG